MKKFKIFSITFLAFILLTGCQTIKEKTDKIVEKENEKLSKYIDQPVSVLQMDLGKPDEDFKNLKGNLEFVYNTKNMEFLVREGLKSIQKILLLDLYPMVVFKVLARK